MTVIMYVIVLNDLFAVWRKIKSACSQDIGCHFVRDACESVLLNIERDFPCKGTKY